MLQIWRICIETEYLSEIRQFLRNSLTHSLTEYVQFIDHALLQFAFSSVESLCILQRKGQTILHIWPWPWKTVSNITSQYGHFQSKSNMIQSCLFLVTDEIKSMVNWKIYTNEFAAKAEFFSNDGNEPHICANSA